MKAAELVEGAKYILHLAGDPIGVYEGKHEGKLTLADGSTFYGGSGALRFRYTDASGVECVALLETGARVEEPLATREERELLVAQRAARLTALTREATEFLVSLGLEVFTKYGGARNNPKGVELQYIKEDIDLIELDQFTIGKLKIAIANARKTAQ